MQSIEEVRLALKDGRRVRSLASLIRVAVEDGREMLQRSDVLPTYGYWCRDLPSGPAMTLGYDGNGAETCAACLAGAVIIGTLTMDDERIPNIEGTDDLDTTFPPTTVRALHALDSVRQGAIQSAYGYIDCWPDDGVLLSALEKHRERWGGAIVEGAFFTNREGFARHLDALVSLAGVLERIEAPS